MSRTDEGLEDWLAALGGQRDDLPVAGQSSARAEAAMLRRLVKARHAQRAHAVQSPSLASEAAHWQRVRMQLSLPSTAAGEALAPSAARRWAANQPAWAWAAGLTAAVVLLPWIVQPHADKAPPSSNDDASGVVQRGGAAPQVLTARSAAEASAMADRVEGVLRDHGQQYRRTRLGLDGWQIQAKVATDVSAAASLRLQGVVVPANRLLNLQLIVDAAPLKGSAASEIPAKPATHGKK